jgi:hypothetical protein
MSLLDTSQFCILPYNYQMSCLSVSMSVYILKFCLNCSQHDTGYISKNGVKCQLLHMFILHLYGSNGV